MHLHLRSTHAKPAILNLASDAMRTESGELRELRMNMSLHATRYVTGDV